MAPAVLIALHASAGDGLVFGNTSGWTVFTDPARDYRCSAEARYEGGSLIRLGYDVADTLYLAVMDPDWNVTGSSAVQLARLGFDDRREFSVRGEAIPSSDHSSAGIRVNIPADVHDAFVADFMASHTLTIALENGNPLDLSLAGSLGAVRMLGDCQRSMSRHSDAAR